MRRRVKSSMIGSLLFYGLYPFSRYLFRPPVEAPKSLPPAVVNDTSAWDGGVVTSRTFTPTQTTLLDQWLNPSRSNGETEERMKEPDADKEQPMAVLHEAAKNDRASTMQSAPKEKETEVQDGQEQDKVELLVKQKKEVTADAAEDISQEGEMEALLESSRSEERIQVDPFQMQEKMEVRSIEESVSPSQQSVYFTTYPVEQHIHTQSSEQSVDPSRRETECWDEYLVPTPEENYDDINGSTVEFAPLLSNPLMHLNRGERHDSQTGWHFPTGPGLAEEEHCPLWHFPSVSYYPSLEPTASFEVMWRVWDESPAAAESTLVPLTVTNTWMDFTVMSYNILAQDLLQAHEELYSHCPLEVLEWNYRCSLLLKEIQKWSPDILCLQEVQENHYHDQLHPVLSDMGYTCVYKQRTGDKTDGCATCYRSSCFTDVSVTLLEFFRPETELLDRHNVGVVLLLRPVVTQGSKVQAKGPFLCVANTHLLFNPRRGDIKLAQLAIVLAELHRVVRSCQAKGEHCNIILSGDFNAVPHTPLYQLITTGELFFQGLPAWTISGQEDLAYSYCQRLFAPLWPSCLGITDSCQYASVNDGPCPPSGTCKYSHDLLLQLRFCPDSCVRPRDLPQIPGVTDNTPDASRRNPPYALRHTISHQLDLQSVYKHTLPGSGNPEVTTLHSETGATVDYIFYSPKRTFDENAADGFVSEGLKLIGCLSLLSEDVLWSMEGLPNHIFPSDHLSLLAKFRCDVTAV